MSSEFMMNPDLDRLQPYPFEKLKKLKEGLIAPAHLEHIGLYIGEPRQPTPSFINEAVLTHLHGLSSYPLTKGSLQLRTAIGQWLESRFCLPANTLNTETQVLPVNGTREALFAFAQAIIDRSKQEPLVLMPNPFYQIYEGAALLAGARPYFLPCTPESGFMPDFDAVDDATWERCQLLYVCSPGNPTGAVIPLETLQKLIRLSVEHDFVIASDECYSEIYFDEDNPPVGLLQAAAQMGHSDFRNCVVFHSLSKRSNAPGLRSGFVAGDANIMEKFLLYRTYHGSAMPAHHQAASLLAWQDEAHVRHNRDSYRQRFDVVLETLDGALDVQMPQAGFYLWAKTPVDDASYARDLFHKQNVTVLPGSFLSREVNGFNPGAGRIRMALVAPLDECAEAAQRIKNHMQQL